MTKRWKFRIPPLPERPAFWGWSYIISIFAFAYGYYALDVPLTQSTTVVDRDFVAAKRELAAELNQTIYELTLPATEEGAPTIGSYVVVEEVLSDKVILRLSVTTFSTQGKGGRASVVIGGAALPVELRSTPLQISTEGNAPQMYTSALTFGPPLESKRASDDATSNAANNAFLAALRSSPDVLNWGGENQSMFHIRDNEVAALARHLMSEVDGTLESGANPIRLVYFSSVTATTLGYGDIVPVDDRGRLLVIVQTILSMILIGVFLNSLARRRYD